MGLCSNIIIFCSLNLFLIFEARADSFVCRPWINSQTKEIIGESFSVSIEEGSIYFRGNQSSVYYGSMIYTHPIYDIFIAPGGEIITAGKEGLRVRVNIYFSDTKITFFNFTTCGRI